MKDYSRNSARTNYAIKFSRRRELFPHFQLNSLPRAIYLNGNINLLLFDAGGWCFSDDTAIKRLATTTLHQIGSGVAMKTTVYSCPHLTLSLCVKTTSLEATSSRQRDECRAGIQFRELSLPVSFKNTCETGAIWNCVGNMRMSYSAVTSKACRTSPSGGSIT